MCQKLSVCGIHKPSFLKFEFVSAFLHTVLLYTVCLDTVILRHVLCTVGFFPGILRVESARLRASKIRLKC